MHSDFRGKSKVPGKEKLLRAIESFSLIEKILFYFFVMIFAGSSLFLFVKADDYFMTEIPSHGGEIKEGVVGYPRYINPLLPVTDSGRDLTSLIYSGLMKIGPDGTLINDLAKNINISDDGLTYTIILKDNIFFQDQIPVTANDVSFTIKKILDPALKSPKAASWNGVDVKVINNKEIQFTLKHPYAPFIENLTIGIMPMHIWKDVDSDGFAFSQFNFEPIGSGPYKIKDIQRNSSGLPLYYHLVPFNKYALGNPYVDDIYVYFFTEEDKMVSAFENGTITSMNSISPKNLEIIKNSGQVIQTSLPRIFGVFFNQNQSSVLINKEVRQALSEAVDKNEIIKEVLGGYGNPVSGPIPLQISGVKYKEETPEEKISSAKNILSDAGWALDQYGVLAKKTKKTSVELSFSISTANSPDLKRTAELLKDTWQKLGAKVDVKVFDIADLQQNVIRQRKYDALLFGEVIGRNLDLYAFWHSSERNDPGLNLAMYANPKADKILEQIRQEDDYTKKVSLLQSLEKMIIDDIPATFLYSPNFIYIVPKNLSGINLKGITSSSERFSNVDKWYTETEKVWTIFKDISNKI